MPTTIWYGVRRTANRAKTKLRTLYAVRGRFMPASYSLKIITPQGAAYEETIYHTFLPTENGFVGVLANHAPYLVSSKGGRMVIQISPGVEKIFQVGPGFFEVHHNEAVFLTQTCTSE